MAATLAGRRLTESHRLAQNRLGAATVARLLEVWPLLDAADLDASTQRWLRVAVPLVQQQRRLSATLAADYLRTFRAIELGTLSGLPRVAIGAADPAVLATSLTVTGPVKVKQALAAGRTEVAAMDLGAAQSSGSGMRHAMSGGRDHIAELVRRDPRAIGYARVTSGNACAFCVTLSSRGAVYGKDSADFEAHDHCSCGAEPVYRADAPLPPSVERNRELYREAQAAEDTSGHQINQVRQLLDRN